MYSLNRANRPKTAIKSKCCEVDKLDSKARSDSIKVVLPSSGTITEVKQAGYLNSLTSN